MAEVYIGIDLSGPANAKETAMSIWQDGKLTIQSDCDDEFILKTIEAFIPDRTVFVALDAPLSYQMHGGFRDVDRALRAHLNQHGFTKIGVMAPTMTKMAYLTLRGIRLWSLLKDLNHVSVFETHPGAALVVSGLDYDLVTQVKTSQTARNQIQQALSEQHQCDLNVQNDHELMAFSAMLSAKRYAAQQRLFEFQSNVEQQPLFIL
jgi:predicted nuclease with RNAse H fold